MPPHESIRIGTRCRVVRSDSLFHGWTGKVIERSAFASWYIVAFSHAPDGARVESPRRGGWFTATELEPVHHHQPELVQ